MKSTKQKQGGFTLLEMMIVMIVASILIAPMMSAFLATIESKRMETTVAEITDLFQSAQHWAADNSGSWPGQVADCANAIGVLAAAEYLVGFNPVSAYGTNFRTECGALGLGPRRFNVIVNVGDHDVAQELANILPGTTVTGLDLEVSVQLPSHIPAFDLLLPRNGERPMTGTLNMDSNQIANAGKIDSSYVEADTVRLMRNVSVNGVCTTKEIGTTAQGELLSCVSGRWKESGSSGVKFARGSVRSASVIYPISGFAKSQCIFGISGQPTMNDGGYKRSRHYSHWYQHHGAGWRLWAHVRNVQGNQLRHVSNSYIQYQMVCAK